ncbi:phosphate transport system substrate-binding protein [Sagittula marina]|uniref:Phosphate transport system substrate-binding protein n=1 Tax=Sagittula marina TaxID=943940 RepID=A0A7W6DJ58_9RHOB|nr:phosphate ABC transporter substrate-binding/OmpA family protein [Sagittula marina]MBB3983993.1 phosphate transport system substrate-binding protein [Sagittula marina]
MTIQRAAIFAALFCLQLLCLPFSARAQDITLSSRDGSIELKGTLLGFDGEFYRIDTRFGILTVDGSGVSCTGIGCPSLIDYVADLQISGSATLGRVMLPALIEAFAMRSGLATHRETEGANQFTYTLTNMRTSKPVGRFHFRVSNTDDGFVDLLSRDADIVMALREIRPAEAKLAREAGLGDLTLANRSTVLALDALVPVISPSNPVDRLSVSELVKILSGQETNWKAFGGPDAPITVHMRDAASGLAQSVEDRLLKPGRATLGPVTRHASNTELSNAVARDPFGIALASFSEIGNTKALPVSGPCGFDLHAARRTVKTEDYPLTTPAFLYMPARRLPALARDFLKFTRSTQAQIVIRRAGFVDQSTEEIRSDLQGDRLANAILVADGAEGLKNLQRLTKTLLPMRRLTTSFRFETGSSRLDAQSRSNVLQLARALEIGTYDGRKVLFVGFSDAVGPAEANLSIAHKRAEAVRIAVELAAETANFESVTLSSDAFGEAMPMACDDTSWGREVNRRVEVWVR